MGFLMDTTPLQRRAPIGMLFLGVVAGGVAGWFARPYVVVPGSELSAREDSPAHSAAGPLAQPTKAESPASSPGPLIDPTKAESRAAAPAGGGAIPAFVTNAGTPVAKASAGKEAFIADESEMPSTATALSKTPAIDDHRDAVSARCTFGPGNGGSWPNGKLTVGDAAWQGSALSKS
jgi:hypothetical protein